MKKLLTACLAGAVSCVLLAGTAGCGPTADVSGDAFSTPDVVVKAGAISDALDISDLLFGAFLEDINYASYALDDNLVANGNFESLSDNGQDRRGDRWAALTGATLAVENTDGIFADHAVYRHTKTDAEAYSANVNPNYAAVTVTAANGGITNKGYEFIPMAVSAGEKFDLSLFAKAPEGAATMTVAVVSDGKELASTSFSLPEGNEWIKYKALIGASEGSNSNVSLQITFSAPGKYYVDAVALETRNSTAGIKNYIFDAIKEMGPKFLRFPGGCIIEGDNANKDADGQCVEVYDWKNSVGAVVNGPEAGDDTIPAFTYKVSENGNVTETTTYGEWATRTNNYDLWGYNMDYGLGFYDYFVLCDTIGASPVPILNCGLSDQGGAASASARGTAMYGRHGKYVEDYIQDAFDLIAFANGSVTSSDAHEKEWAQLRVNMGHAEPFGVKYIGIGNEQFGTVYYTDYGRFVDALQDAKKENAALYGDIQFIVGNGMSFADCQYAPNSANVANKAATSFVGKSGSSVKRVSDYGIVDHHYYMGHADFFHYATPETCIYDQYSREMADRYKVFVGEYSANNATRYYETTVQLTAKRNTWVTALSEAAYMTGLERNGDIVELAAYAPMFAVYGKTAPSGIQWDVDMMYVTNTKLVRSTNYYVQQLFMCNSGTHSLRSVFGDFGSFDNVTVLPEEIEVDCVYQAVTYDEATGDIIVKFVNAGLESIKLNVELADKVGKVATVTVLDGSECGFLGENTLDKEDITPKTYTLGVKSTFGYEAPAYSVTAIRIPTK